MFIPIRSVNYSIHSFEDEKATKEFLILEVWTNGSIEPKEAIKEASYNLVNLFTPLVSQEYQQLKNQLFNEDEKNKELNFIETKSTAISDNANSYNLYNQIFLDQLELSSRAYNSLKKNNINTISDLLKYSYEDLLKIKNFGKKSADQVMEQLKKRFKIQF